MTLSETLFVSACALMLLAPDVPAMWRWAKGKLQPPAPAPPPQPIPGTLTITVGEWSGDDDDDDEGEPEEEPPVRRVYTGTNAFPRTNSYFTDPTPAPQPPAAPKLAAGRQNLKQMFEADPFGQRKAWSRPFPSDAKSAAWADLHTYAEGSDKQRDPRAAFIGQDPPIAMLCPGCELEQPPLRTDDVRPCPYCGLRLKLFGARVFWWREAIEVQPWSPTRGER